MPREKSNYHSRAKNTNSRIIRISMSGLTLKNFDAEVARNEDSESLTGRDLIREALAARTDKRNNKNPFFKQ